MKTTLNWGLVAGLGGAFAIIAWYDNNPVFAGVVAVGAVIASAIVYFKVDRPRLPGSDDTKTRR